jgi:hypothetical protein
MYSLIEINLSEEFERRRRKSMPRKQVPAALGAAIAVTIASLAAFYIFVTIQAGQVGRTKSQLQAIAKTLQDANTYQTRYDSLRARERALNAWHVARVAWASRWLHIANVTPEFVYLTEVLITPVDVNANTQRLVLRGRAFGAAGEGDVLRLVNNCKHAALLTNYFTSVTLASVTSEGAEKTFTVELQRSATAPQ